ncbi:hypothetical protein A2592_00130 [Candidatus Kaiserbacteria bacterium RIFOXYD1_FULL_42_15]|uniref:Uncharacterized protein n=1 Tax=Candidatus Kaiserbacteria bacterium RIFOXYD1_FULL_42_15 TaxID=1798532 RepID=A0A1F6FQZ0_9BACT|nr:MAG: hypothetical protein A2592_00130 [Candidatus Kaiserbacteria bacterium RIFOXYD1_FULL_42_15]
MNFFKDTTFSWLQIGAFKLSTIFFGVVIGAYWSEIFMPYLTLLLAVAVISGLYVGMVWFRQQ